MIGNFSNSYTIRVDFSVDDENPSRVFSALAELIDTYKNIDAMLAKSINSTISIKQTLESVSTGSITAKLMDFITIDDQLMANQEIQDNAVDTYIAEARMIVSRSVCREGNIGYADVVATANSINALAEQTEVRNITTFSSPDELSLAKNMKAVADATKKLREHDTAFIGENEQELELSKSANVEMDAIEQQITDITLDNVTRKFLKIKKPDFLGNSCWEFKHGNDKITAKILDAEWITEFRSGSFELKPGDGIDADVREVAKYDRNRNLISSKTTIEHVHGIITFDATTEELQYEDD